jgi:hypothetical protein
MATDTIDVGGIIYRMDGTPSVNYMYRSIDDFVKTFEPISKKTGIPLPTIQKLFQKYMNASPYMKSDYSAIRKKDKDMIRDILLEYLVQLQRSKDAVGGNSIIAINFDRTYLNIKEILAKLDGPQDDSNVPLTCKENRKVLKDISPDTRRLMILELSWLLSHPKKIKSKEECMWAEKVAELSTIRLRDLTKNMENIQQLSEDVAKMDENDAVRQRIEQLLRVYGITKIMKETATAEKSTTEQATTEQATTEQAGGNIMSTKFITALDYAINPLFDFIKSKYSPIYGFLETCFKKSHAKKHKILPQLLTLLHISNYFLSSHKDKSLSRGIYRIRSVHKDLVQFITSHLKCSATHINKMTTKKQKTFLDTLHGLFPIRVSSLPKQKTVSPFVVDTEIPTVRFMTLDGNLTIPPFESFYKKGTESEKESYYQSMTNYFTAGDIYMVYSPSEEIPMNLYEIDISEIDTSDKTISIKTPITYFSNRGTHLQDFATVDEHAIYTNTEMVLSIFISLKLPTTQ